MLLAIDIGNSNVTLGVWNGQKWQSEWRLRTAHERTADEYGVLLSALLGQGNLADAIDTVVLSSVVPLLTTTFVQLSERLLQVVPLLVTAETDTGIAIRTENPMEVGADRIVNAVAAYEVAKGPCIVIDMGTATTFDAVSARGELLGVAIAPGLRLAADALATRAAQLSQVPLQAPPVATGRNTVHAMQSGLIFGYVALIEGMVARMLAEHPDREEGVCVIGTGGLISLIAPHTKIIDRVEPWLTLTGLRVIQERARA